MKFFESVLPLEFELYDENNLAFLQDYHQSKNMALNKWKKLATKVDFSEGEELLFRLLLSLKDDVMKLEDVILQKNPSLVLKEKSTINAVAFEGIRLEDKCLQEGALYYAHTEINRQMISFFFKALSTNEASITQMKKEDKTLYDIFVVDIQRQLINKRKDKQ